jgi:hypothetical protein
MPTLLFPFFFTLIRFFKIIFDFQILNNYYPFLWCWIISLFDKRFFDNYLTNVETQTPIYTFLYFILFDRCVFDNYLTNVLIFDQCWDSYYIPLYLYHYNTPFFQYSFLINKWQGKEKILSLCGFFHRFFLVNESSYLFTIEE